MDVLSSIQRFVSVSLDSIQNFGNQHGEVSYIQLLQIRLLNMISVRTVLLAVIGFFPTEARGAIGGLDYTKEERQKLAKK